MTPAQPFRQRSLLIALAAAFATATIGGALTRIGPWYYALEKPAFQPPDWLFGPAWTLIFILAAVAAHRAWQFATDSGGRRRVLLLFVLNAVLNVGWSYLFFFRQRPDLALYESVALWLSVAVLIGVFGRRPTSVTWLLAPYLAWVSFATALNAAIVDINPPFA
ncbi:MAG: TspO/MBR family protein [Pseudomonadota bacterium]